MEMKAQQLDLMDSDRLSNEELVALYKKNRDINIRNKIIINNLGLIYAAAKKRIKNPSCYTLEDLVQEGVIGMMKGIERFDTTKDTSFSTYVYYWIVQQMDRALINNGYMIRLPAYIYEKISTLSTMENTYISKNEEMDLKNMCNEANMTEQEYFLLHYYKRNYSNFTSLNAVINTDSDENYVELQDYIPCQDISVEDKIISDSLKEQVIEVLEILSPKEREILELRFGLNGNDPLTLEAIGNRFNLTRERIRQIENKALNKLKRLNLRRGLKDYLLEY